MKPIIIFLVLYTLVTSLGIVYAGEQSIHNYKPSEGYVPNEETAVKIAVAVWNSIYDSKQIEKEKPYKAVLSGGIWFVSGSLPNGRVGGVAEAEISKDNGCILRISHGK